MPIALVAILVGSLAVVMFAVALGRAAALGDAELERQARERWRPEIAVTRQRYRPSGSRAQASAGSQPPT
jgi:hypothetical protein